MFEPIPELSSDLEWMLQSGQASRAMLAEALVEEFSRSLYRLALSLLDEPQAARNAVKDGITAALLNQYRYRSQSTVAAWFYAQALPSLLHARRQAKEEQNGETAVASTPSDNLDATLWRSLDALPEKERLPILLQAILGLSEAEIAAALKTAERDVCARLEAGKMRLAADLRPAGFTRQNLPAGDLDAQIAGSLQGRWPAPDFSKEEEVRLAAEADRQAGARGARLQRFSSLNELVLVGVAVGVVAAIVWGVSILLPEPDLSEALNTPTRRSSEIAQGRSAPPFGSRGSSSRDAGARPNRRRSSPAPAATPTPDGFFYYVQPGDTLSSIAADLGIAVKALRDFNRIPSGTEILPGRALVIPGASSISTLPSPTPVTPVPQPSALAASSGLDRILERINQPRNAWNTLWFDARILSYGPAGYIGPARVQRVQLWLSKDQMLLLGGSPFGLPETALLHTQSDVYIAQPQSGQYWFSPFSERQAPALQSLMDSLNLLLGDSPRDRGLTFGGATIDVIGSDQHAGREVLLLEERSSQGVPQRRLWVDARTGLTLRVQTLTLPPLSGPGAVNRVDLPVEDEVVVLSIAYDIDFSQDLLDPRLPWRGGFAEDYSGKPARIALPLSSLQAAEGAMVIGAPPSAGNDRLPTGRELPLEQKAPAGFDPSGSPLAFQFPASFNALAVESTPRVNVFAGSYLIGSTRLANPWTMICARSPDGERLAFVGAPDLSASPRDQQSLLQWFNLNELDRPSHTLPGISVAHFAFSPDSRSIALLGTDGRGSGGKLYVLDTQTGKLAFLLSLADAKSFVWSPDGKFLALIGRSSDPQFNESVMVVRLESGKVTYSRSIDFESGNGSADWPTLDWGVDFPVEMGTLKDCAAPPPQSALP